MRGLSQLFSRKQTLKTLRIIEKNIDVKTRTFESKLIQIQTAFETLRKQNEEIIRQNNEITKILMEQAGMKLLGV